MDDSEPVPDKLVVFAHGKESGPWGTKITRLAVTARQRGFEVISPDYSQTPDPRARVAQLLARAPRAGSALVLAGSSMGGYVSAMACAGLKPQALLLIAPALYFQGYDEEPPPPPAINAVVHGWSDDIVPVDRAIRYARRHRARLHLLDAGHTLNDRLPELEAIFDELLARAELMAAYRQAVYVVESAEEPIKLHVDRVDADADRRLASDCGVVRDWAIVTACNPFGQACAAEANARDEARLRERLAAAGVRTMPAAGTDPAGRWPSEASLLLCDPPEGLAEALGREFNQNAILRGRLGGAPELVWLR